MMTFNDVFTVEVYFATATGYRSTNARTITLVRSRAWIAAHASLVVPFTDADLDWFRRPLNTTNGGAL